MKLPRQLTKRQLIHIVEEIRDILYMSDHTPEHIAEYYDRTRTKRFLRKLEKEQPKRLTRDGSMLLSFLDPDKTWESDSADYVNDVLARYGLCPTRLMTQGEACRKPTSNENWKDDSVQFPRLLAEIEMAGITNLLKEDDWQSLEQSMDLAREDIMALFGRAQKEWDRIKKETR